MPRVSNKNPPNDPAFFPVRWLESVETALLCLLQIFAFTISHSILAQACGPYRDKAIPDFIFIGTRWRCAVHLACSTLPEGYSGLPDKPVEDLCSLVVHFPGARAHATL